MKRIILSILIVIGFIYPELSSTQKLRLEKNRLQKPTKLQSHPIERLLSGTGSLDRTSRNSNKLLVLLIDFLKEEVDDPQTTGNGKFIQDPEGYPIPIGKPPHDHQFFTSQLEVLTYYYNAVSLFSQEKFKEALSEFQKIIEQGSDGEYEAKARYEIGRCHFNLQKYDLCIKHFTSLIQKYPKHPDIVDALYYVGRSYEGMGNTEKAAGFLKKVISMAKAETPIMRKAKKALQRLGG